MRQTQEHAESAVAISTSVSRPAFVKGSHGVEWDMEGIAWPLVVLALGLLLAAWVMWRRQGAAGWSRWAAAGLVVVSLALLGQQVLTHSLRPLVPTMDQCLALMEAEPGEAPESPSDVAAPDTMGFVSGAVWGVYWRLAEDVVAIARQGGVPLTNVRTRGSVDNIARMKSSANAGVGIVQGDVPLTMKENARVTDGMAQLGALATLHRESVQVLTRAGAMSPGGGSLTDLADKHVVFAKDSEGARLTAQYLLRRKDITPRGGAVEALPAERAVCEVVTGGAAAMVVVTGKPAPLLLRLRRLERDWSRAVADLRFVPIQPKVGELPDVYEASELGRSDYPWLSTTAPVPTLAMRAMLVSYDFGAHATRPAGAKCLQIGQLVCALRRNRLRLDQPPYDPAWHEVGKMGSDIPSSWTPSKCLPKTC